MKPWHGVCPLSCCADSVVVISGMDGHEQLHLFLPWDLWVLKSSSSLSHCFSLSLHVSGTCSRLVWECSSTGACPITRWQYETHTPSVRIHKFTYDDDVFICCLNWLEARCVINCSLALMCVIVSSFCVKKRGTVRVDSSLEVTAVSVLFVQMVKIGSFAELHNAYRK